MRHFVVRSVTPHHVSTDKRQNMGEKQKESLVTDTHTHTQKAICSWQHIWPRQWLTHYNLFLSIHWQFSSSWYRATKRAYWDRRSLRLAVCMYALKYIYIFLSVCLKCVRAESVLQSKLLPFSSLCHRGCHVDHHGLSKHELVCK